MTDTAELHAEQVAYWNGEAALRWVAHQARLDVMMAEIARHAIERAAVQAGETVLDVGCGAGATTALLAEQAGPRGRVVALDVSVPLLAAARARISLGTVAFRLGDAAVEDVTGLDADLLFSRFGVMFFGDPVGAFCNLRRGMRVGGRVTFACWRTPSENPWMILPLAAVTPLVPPLAKLGPEDPGPFSFADPARVTRILEGAGFSGVTMAPVDLSIDLAEGKGLDGAVSFAAEIGAASRALTGQSPEIQAAAVSALRQALTPFLEGGAVRLPAAIWIVQARA